MLYDEIYELVVKKNFITDIIIPQIFEQNIDFLEGFVKVEDLDVPPLKGIFKNYYLWLSDKAEKVEVFSNDIDLNIFYPEIYLLKLKLKVMPIRSNFIISNRKDIL